MAYQDTWDEITSDPRWESLSPAMQAKARRKFALQVRKTEGKQAARDFIGQHVVTTPKPTNTRVRDNLVESFKENAIPHYADIAKGAARTLVDEGPTALVRRATGKAADAAFDAVIARPLGLPTTAEQDKKMGRDPNRRILPNTPPEERTVGENIGGFVGQLADPINLAAPLNVFAKAAPVAKGINLLPKTPPPMAPQILKGMAGAGATNALIAGGTSAASQALDGQELDPTRTAIDTGLGFAGGAVLGGPAAALNILARRDAAMRGFNAAQMDAAARVAAAPAPQLPAPKPLLALPPARSGPVIPSDGTVIPAPRGPVQMTPGTPVDRQVAAAVSDWVDNDVRGMQAVAGPRAGAEMAAPRPIPEPSGPVIEMPPIGARSTAEVSQTADDGWGDYAAKMRGQMEARQAQIRAMEEGAPLAPRNLAALLSEEAGTFDQQAAIDALADLTAKIWRKVGRDPNAPNYIADPAAPGGFRVDLDYNDLTWLKAASRLAESGDQDAQRALMLTQQINQGRMSAPAGDLNVSTSAPGMRGNLRRVASSPEEVAARAASTRQMRADNAAADALNDEWINPEHVQVKTPGGAILDGVNQTPAPKYGIAGKTLRRLASDESGQASMPHPDDVRAAANAAIDAGIDAADTAARLTRPIDQLIEQMISRSGVARPVGAAAGLIRRGKDAAKDRLRTGVTGGRVEIADDIGKGFVSSKAPTQYQDLKDRIRSQTIRQMQGLTDEARRLEEEGVNQEALYDIVTDRNLSSDEAERVRNLTNQVSADLLDVGNLTPEQYAAWQGQYLRRLYEHHENAIGNLARRARKAVTLSGSKRRGTTDTMTPAALATRNKPWQEAGTTPDGRVILEDPTDGKRIMVSRRNVGNFTGTWKVIGNAPGGKVKAVRDWTPTEREAMGELKNVSRSLRKIAEEAYTNLNNGRLLKAVSENPEWAVRDADGLTPPEGWVYIDKATVKANGVRKWGALADHWVEPSIAADLAAATNNDLVGQVVKLLRATTGINLFKKVKVVYNPASHGNQLMQNMITLEAAGGSVSDVPRAARLLRTADDPLVARLSELGLYGDDYLSTEGMAGAGSADSVGDLSDRSYIPRWAQGAARLPQAADAWASNLYQFSDNMTRTAYVLGKMDEGVPIEQAVREARERFYNGNTVNSQFARLGSASLLPFIKPALYTFDRLPELIEANPAKAVKILAYWFAFDQGFKALSGHLVDEDGRQALLPDYQKGTAKTIPLPIQDTKGQSLLFDYQRMNPVGSAFGVNDRTGFGPVPEAFVPLGGPLGGVIQALMNKDAFRDEPLRTSTENRTAEFLAGHFMPGFTGNVQRLGRAMQGLPEYTGGPSYDVPTAAANVFGLKVQPFNPDINYDKNFRKFEAERREVEDAIRRLDSDLEGGFINDAQYERELANLEARLDDLDRRFEEWDARAQRGLDAFQR